MANQYPGGYDNGRGHQLNDIPVGNVWPSGSVRRDRSTANSLIELQTLPTPLRR